MRRLALIVACVLCVGTAQAQVFSAISAVISVGQWIHLGQKRVYYIEVDSRADSFEAARHEGFRLAVEQAVGTLILSETESENYRLRRNDIITYASGYVDRFEIIERSHTGSQIQLRMRVWVAHSAIAGRLLHQQAQPREISGNTIATQIQTIQQQQQSADRLLNAVMQDFPHRAFDVVMEPAQVVLDNQRQAHLRVPFVVSWSSRYLDALAEVLSNINQYPQCTGALVNCNGARSRIEIAKNVFAKDPGAWFNDDSAWQVMMSNIVTSRPMYRLTLNTGTGRNLQYCYPAREIDSNEYRPRYFVTVGPGLVKLFGNNRERIVLTVPLMDLPVQNITRASVDIVRQAQCN